MEYLNSPNMWGWTANKSVSSLAESLGSSASAASSTPVPTGKATGSMLRSLSKSLLTSASRELSASSEVTERYISLFFSYLTSPFALLCMGMAIVLNRTVVFATTRRPTTLPFVYRILLRSVAVYTLTVQTVPLIRALLCSSPALSLWVSSHTWLSAPLSTAASLSGIPSSACPGPEILWDLYRAICIGHFIETFSSVIQGRIPYSETGMTLFEYSVAFQEVQLSEHLSVEILVVAIISSLSQIAFHVQGMLNSYKYRLIPSSFFGILFLSYFGYAVLQGNLFYFPSVCIIGYVPQLAISIVVVLCGSIYALACLFTGGPSYMQTSLQSIHIESTEDFYSCLMKLGVIALTSATKATYLTEAKSLCAPLETWIECVEDPAYVASATPYDNEVSGPIAHITTDASGATRYRRARGRDIAQLTEKIRFMTTSRLVWAFQMVRALITITLYLVWKVGSDAWQRMWPRTKSDHDLREEEFDNQLMRLRNSLIYADLNEEYGDGYASLLQGDTIPEIDDSADYEPDDVVSEDGYEYESGYSSADEDDNTGGYVSGPSELRRPQLSRSNSGALTPTSSRNPLAEFYDLVVSSPDYFLSLLAPRTHEAAEDVQILVRHLSSSEPGPLTRSHYRRLHSDHAQEVLQLIRERRKPLGDADDSARSVQCVVCQSAPRQVVLWPCRCYALCEDCRVALALKNFQGCVCCRQPVESFSRVFVP